MLPVGHKIYVRTYVPQTLAHTPFPEVFLHHVTCLRYSHPDRIQQLCNESAAAARRTTRKYARTYVLKRARLHGGPRELFFFLRTYVRTMLRTYVRTHVRAHGNMALTRWASVQTWRQPPT